MSHLPIEGIFDKPFVREPGGSWWPDHGGGHLSRPSAVRNFMSAGFERGGAMRFYAKLALFVTSFLILAPAGGGAGREWAWDVWFAARCQVAHLLDDQRLWEQLVAEAACELQRRMERQLSESLAEAGPRAPHVFPPDALARADVVAGAADDEPARLTYDNEWSAPIARNERTTESNESW
jgi:hypothetical protein